MKSNIGFLVPGFPADENDSTCIPPLQLFIKHFAESYSDFNLFVVAFQYPFKRGSYKWNNIPVYSAGGKGRGGFFRLLTWLWVIYFFVRIQMKTKVKGVHSFWMSECALIGNILSKVFRIPHINSLMGQDVKASNRYLRYVNKNNLRITSVSLYAAEIFNHSVNHKVDEIIPFGIDENHIAHSIDKREIDIIGVGSLIQLKNFTTFIEIVDELVKEIKNFQAVVIGDGVLKPQLQNCVKEKNLENYIRFTGQLPREEVLKYMLKSKILLHTSLFESQGYVFLEGLKCGLDVVCFDVGFLPASKKIHICEDKTVMINTTKSLLKKELDYTSETPFTTSETVSRFYELYSNSGFIKNGKRLR